MCDIESVNKISNYLKVNPGKIFYSGDKVISRTSKQNETLLGFSTILHSLARESKEAIVKNSFKNPETECQVSQWIEYAVLYVNSAARDKHVAKTVLEELNTYLTTRSYFVGQTLTLADLVVFYVLRDTMSALSHLDKENYLNLSRWYDHLQQMKSVRQGADLINFSTIRLIGWATGTHL